MGVATLLDVTIDDIKVGQYVTLRTGRMWYKIERIWASESGYRFASLVAYANNGRTFVRCVSERDVSNGVLTVVS